MKSISAAAASALLLTTATAYAGGLDRSGQGIGILFEQGNAISLGMTYVAPTISATNEALTGNIAVPYVSMSAGYKQAITDSLDFGIVIDQPFGADISYQGLLTGMADAELTTWSATGLLRYKITENISLIGGLRVQTVKGDVSLLGGAYTLDVDSDIGLGYVVGAAYEIPEIALRAALTYNSAISHEMTGTEAGFPTTFTQDTPQSINFDFQTGIAQNTMVFGSVRWVDWSSFQIAPPIYGVLTSYASDTITYEIGIGHRINDAFSVAATVGYEAPMGGVFSDLGPTDGHWSAGIGGSWQVNENMKFSGGVNYVALGDANGGALTGGSPFTGNHAIGVGLSLTTNF